MIMAFSRAITFHWSGKEVISTQSLALDLDNTLRRRKGAKSFMGVICGIFDPTHHAIEITVAGHVYPLLLVKDGNFSWIGSPELPLGIGKKTRAFTTHQIDLQPGDSLFCTTDGYIEALNNSGEQVGYEKIVSWTKETKQEDTSQWIQSLLACQSAWSQQRLDDDITLFCLSRNPGETE